MKAGVEDPGELLVGQGPGRRLERDRVAVEQARLAAERHGQPVAARVRGWPPPKRMPSPSSCTTNSRRGMAGSLGAEAPEDAGEVQQQEREEAAAASPYCRATRGRGGGGLSAHPQHEHGEVVAERASVVGDDRLLDAPRDLVGGPPGQPAQQLLQAISPNITPCGAPSVTSSV